MKSYNDCSLAAMERSRRRKEVGSNSSSSSSNNNKNNNNGRPRPRPRPVPGIISRVEPGSGSGTEPDLSSVRPAVGDVGLDGKMRLCTFFRANWKSI